jgi:hypothetical protein
VVQFTAAHATLVHRRRGKGRRRRRDGAVGSPLAFGFHICVVAGTAAGSPVADRRQHHLRARRGGWHRLYNVPIAAASTQMLSGATFTGFRHNDWNNSPTSRSHLSRHRWTVANALQADALRSRSRWIDDPHRRRRLRPDTAGNITTPT